MDQPQLVNGFMEVCNDGSTHVTPISKGFYVSHHLLPEFSISRVGSERTMYYTNNDALLGPSQVVRRGMDIGSRIGLFDMSPVVEKPSEVKSFPIKDGYV